MHFDNIIILLLLVYETLGFTIIKICHSSNSNGKHLTDLFEMDLSQDISKLSLISQMISLESLDKMVKSSKFMLQSQISK